MRPLQVHNAHPVSVCSGYRCPHAECPISVHTWRNLQKHMASHPGKTVCLLIGCKLLFSVRWAFCACNGLHNHLKDIYFCQQHHSPVWYVKKPSRSVMLWGDTSGHMRCRSRFCSVLVRAARLTFPPPSTCSIIFERSIYSCSHTAVPSLDAARVLPCVWVHLWNIDRMVEWSCSNITRITIFSKPSDIRCKN